MTMLLDAGGSWKKRVMSCRLILDSELWKVSEVVVFSSRRGSGSSLSVATTARPHFRLRHSAQPACWLAFENGVG